MPEVTLMTFRDDQVEAVVVAVGVFVELRWNDYTANDWTESYDLLASAVAGLPR